MCAEENLTEDVNGLILYSLHCPMRTVNKGIFAEHKVLLDFNYRWAWLGDTCVPFILKIVICPPPLHKKQLRIMLKKMSVIVVWSMVMTKYFSNLGIGGERDNQMIFLPMLKGEFLWLDYEIFDCDSRCTLRVVILVL